MKKKLLYTICITLIGSMIQSCESFVEIGAPKNASVTASVYADDVGALAAIRGIYHEMVNVGFASGQSTSVTVQAGLSSDEFVNYNNQFNEFANNTIATASSSNAVLWSSSYSIIYYCNAAIEGLSKSTGVSVEAKKQLMGEAKFLRAFTLFYLMNLFGNVPIVLSTDYRVNATLSKNTIQEVTNQIIQDLKESQVMLSSDFQFTSSERVRATSWSATALLARVYLYNKDWSNAEAASTSVIGSTLFKPSLDLNTVFLKNSSDAIWQLMPIVPNQNTNEGFVFVPASPTSLPGFVAVSNTIVSSFEPGDKRKTSWTGNQVVSGNTIYYPFKYKVFKVSQPLTEYSMVMRISEQYLIRAEARAQMGKLSEAMADLDVLRSRAGLPSIQTKIPSPSTDNVLSAVEQERKVELFSEWGHRWFDLKRWNKVDAVLAPLKPAWKATASLYPIPQSELANNSNLNPQNAGY